MDLDLYHSLMTSIADGRLAIFTGAGLSIPAPSCIPSAAELARQCAERHLRKTGVALPEEIREDIEAIAHSFYERGEFTGHFVPLIDWGPFHGLPNRGHLAIADFLACGVIDFSVTANVDVLVENAAQILGEPDFDAAIDGQEANIPHEHHPLLKLHGCYRRDRRKTLWCREQFEEAYWQERVELSRQWLDGRLLGRDVVFVGYWTDWNYLIETLLRCLGTNQPRRVVLVSPDDTAELEAKAPALWAWARQDGITFAHERLSGDLFLDELRMGISRAFVSSVVRTGTPVSSGGEPPVTHAPCIDDLDTTTLYDLRRDFTGTPTGRPVRTTEVDLSYQQLGAFLLKLGEAGAVADGSVFKCGEYRLRVVRANGVFISHARGAFSRPSSFEQIDFVACLGAEDDGGLPADIVRGDAGSSIVRPQDEAEWLTFAQSSEKLGWH